MANLQIIQPYTALIDSAHSYNFKVGEVHLVPGPLVSQALHDAAVAAGWGIDTASAPIDLDPSEIVSDTQADSPVNLTPGGL